ncbi:hypothetical protein D3C72_1722130 [compost metagenome]
MLSQRGVQVEGPRPAKPLLGELHQQGEQHHGKQQPVEPRPAQQRQQQAEQRQLDGGGPEQIAGLKPERVRPQPPLQALDQRQLGPVQGAPPGAEVGQPLHLAVGDLRQPGD